MRKIAFSAVIALTLLGSCSSKPTKETVEEAQPVTVVEHDDLREAVTRHDHKAVGSMADELALSADDLSPEQGVSVLMAFYDMHQQYAAERKMKSDMETMRKFVDVYDIVKSNHGRDFVSALGATTKVYPDVDFTNVYTEFVEKLTQYDGAALSDVAPVEDTIAADTAMAEEVLPPELRPAE